MRDPFLVITIMASAHAYLSFASTHGGAATWWRPGFIVITLIGLYPTVIEWNDISA